jgi:prepilin-type N-terminal cleavage/methylation domain-containing protein
MRRDRGFGLIELMVALSIALVLMTFAVVPLTSWLRIAQQKQAITALREITRAESWYQTSYGNGYVVPSLLVTGPAVPKTCDFPQMLYPPFAQMTVGYFQIQFTAVGTVPQAAGCSNIGAITYFVTATPTGFGGNRYFYADASGQIRYQDNGPASVSSAVWTGQ